MIPPPIEATVPERESEKLGATEKEKIDELKPSKPFPYVLPPNTNQLFYFYPQYKFRQSNVNPFYIKRSLPQNVVNESDTRIETTSEASP